jgi:CubicO group peptidase (beta-lactamase class C family)
MSQFRVLYRQFLFRLADIEALSSHAQGDVQKLLGQFASLLIFVSVIFAIVALTMSGADPADPRTLLLTIVNEQFLISTTMLAVGLFAVLCWDSTFPDRRDVMVLAPLPVRGRTLFLAKVAAVATALGLVVGLLHVVAGIAWPYALSRMAAPQTIPTLTFDAARPPMSPAEVEADLDRAVGPLPPGVGVTIGVMRHGERRVFSYGAARPDSIFEVGSVGKTFTSLILARMVEAGDVRLDDPVRLLLPEGTVQRPPGDEITLLDLATHYSGLPRGPAIRMADPTKQPTAADIFRTLGKLGVWKFDPAHGFEYSNFGVAVLGQALAYRVGRPYPELAAELAAELGLPDTAIALTPEQQARYLPGFGAKGRVPPYDLDGYAPAGGFRSTAGDLLTYLDEQLHPERAPALADAIRLTHVVRPLDAEPGLKMALAWMYRPSKRVYLHGGATPGFLTATLFSVDGDYGVVVLRNHGREVAMAPDLIVERIRQRLAGEPALSLAMVDMGASRNVLRWFAAYWITMTLAGAFVFCCVLGVQGIAAQVLPRPLFLRVSGVLQMAAFCLFVGVYFFQPKLPGFDSFTDAASRDVLMRYPTCWFLGLFHQLNGSMHPALAPLAWRAWIGLAVAVATTASAYGLAYMRTMRKIVEQPDIVPATGGWRLPALGGGSATALAYFSVRSLARSRQHRVILAFYLGVALALTIWLAKMPAAKTAPAEAQAIAASLVLLGFWIFGARVVFALPLELRANWIFRALPLGAGRAAHAGRRRALMAIALAPAVTIAAAVFLSTWPWRMAVAHFAVLVLVGATMVELCAAGPQKIPFACSYLPGKSNIHMGFWGCVVFLSFGVIWLANQEAQVLHDWRSTAVMLGGLAAAAALARWLGQRSAGGDFAELRFEDLPGDAVQKIGIGSAGI